MEEYKFMLDAKSKITKMSTENIEVIKIMNQEEIIDTRIGNTYDKVLAMYLKVAYVQELMMCIDKCLKLFNMEMRKLNGALMVFDINKMASLYKGDKSIYTLKEMKVFCDAI